jgi:peroxiredoxin
MAPRRLSLIALGAALLAGCDPPPPEVPRIDASAAGGYGEPDFKDDAPANATAADFPRSFVDDEGNPVELSKYLGRKVVLVVLRGVPRSEGGGFCPSCLAQAGSLVANQDEFARRGAEVLVLFPGPDERVREFVRAARLRTPGEPPASFRLLTDRECRTCDRLGIRADLAKPSTYVLDTRGRVTYAYVGETSTDRPSVRAVLAQLDRAE